MAPMYFIPRRSIIAIKKGSPFKVTVLNCTAARYEHYVIENNSTIGPEAMQTASGTIRDQYPKRLVHRCRALVEPGRGTRVKRIVESVTKEVTRSGPGGTTHKVEPQRGL